MKKRGNVSPTSNKQSLSPPRLKTSSPRASKQRTPQRFVFLGVLCVAVVSTFWHFTSLEVSNNNIRGDGRPKHTVFLKENGVNDGTDSKPNVWLAGIVRDASTDLRVDILEYLVELNCKYNVSVHVVAGSGVDQCFDTRNALLKQQNFQPAECAAFHLEAEPPSLLTNNIDNRIDRISVVRDYQRQQLRTLLCNHVQSNDVIMIADLDLYSLPKIKLLLNQAQNLSPYDAICAAGIMHRPFGYYDIFATVLLENTFVYPLRGRLEQRLYEEEDPTFIRSNDLYGNYTQWDLLEYFQRQSKQLGKAKGNRNGLPVPVRSCFGGLTLYRAPLYLAEKCTYHVNNINATGLMRYATKTSKRPCEHVVLHECLYSSGNFKIAVQPSLTTEWNADLEWNNTLYPGNRHESLGVFSKRIEQGDRLTSGEYTLRINVNGDLIVKKVTKNSTAPSEIVWAAKPDVGKDIDYWTHAFLMLKNDGVLELVKQVSKSTMEERKHYDDICKDKARCECDVKSDHCKVVVWTTEASTSIGNGTDIGMKDASDNGNGASYVLVLRDDGRLEVVDEKTKAVIWKNEATGMKGGNIAQ